MKRGRLSTIALLAVLLALPSHGVVAGGELDCRISLADEDHNGQPDRATLECPFAGNAGDRVLVYDRAGNMLAGERWEDVTDFEDDVWAFDAAGDGTTNLLIAFRRDGDALVADLYDDQDDDGDVRYSVTAGVLAVQESPYPTVRVRAADGWWLQDGLVNHNLDIEVDGTVRATFHSPPRLLAERQPELTRGLLNGAPDTIIHVRDTNRDGRPDYDIRQVYAPPPLYDYYGTELTVNTRNNELYFEEFIFWPYLGDYVGYIKPYGESVPAIQMDWARSRIEAVAELVASRGQDSNWFIYSMTKFGYEDRTFANFENPFAFYDLAADQDGYPELMIRMEYSGPGELGLMVGEFDYPLQTIRLSWDQDNNQTLDYKLGLYGRHGITGLVAFPDFAVHTVPYAEYPAWVAGRAWDAVFFVADESGVYWSTEGIYEGWDSEWRDYYVTGVADEPSLQKADDIREGLRQEYTPQLLQQPWLYCSPVDHKLHLRQAWGGVWNVDGLHRVRYRDLDGDGYLDQWLFTEQRLDARADEGDVPEKVLRSLQAADEMLVYGDAERVRLVRSVLADSFFEALPPRDHAEWRALGQQLQHYEQDFAPSDFLAMMRLFEGPTTEIEGAQLEGFRLTESGFRTVLHLQPGFRVLSDFNGTVLAALPAGSYVVTYDGTFEVRPLTPAHITLPAGGISYDPPAPAQMDWVTIRAVLHNNGQRDVQSLPVHLYASMEGAEPLLVASEEVSIPGEGEHAFVAKWAPSEPGHWTVWVEADSEGSLPPTVELGPMAPLEVHVQAGRGPDMFRLAGPYDGSRFTWPVALLLIGTALAAVCVAGAVLAQGRWPSQRVETSEGER